MTFAQELEPGEFSELRARLGQLAESAEYRPEQPTPIERLREQLLEWVMGLLSSLFGSAAAESILPWFVFGCLTFAIAVVAWHFLRRMARRSAQPALRRNSGGDRPTAEQPGSDPFAGALEAAQAGDLRLAGLRLYQATVTGLDARGSVEFSKRKTPGDYRRELKATERETFSKLMQGLDPVLWGNLNPTADAFGEWLRSARELGAGPG